jgi:hypothetical protein
VGAVEVAELLNAWWLLRAPPRPEGDGLGAPWQSIAEGAVGWPRHTGPARTSVPLPIAWTSTNAGAVTEYGIGNSPASSGTQRIAPNPITTNRGHVVMATPWAAPAGCAASPANASLAATAVLTLRHLADELDDRGALANAPTRQLRGEAGAYRALADSIEADTLPALSEPWAELAQQAIAEAEAAARTPLAASGRRYRTTPVSLA